MSVKDVVTGIQYVGIPTEDMDATVRFLPFWERGVEFFTIAGPNNEWIEFCQKL